MIFADYAKSKLKTIRNPKRSKNQQPKFKNRQKLRKKLKSNRKLTLDCENSLCESGNCIKYLYNFASINRAVFQASCASFGFGHQLKGSWSFRDRNFWVFVKLFSEPDFPVRVSFPEKYCPESTVVARLLSTKIRINEVFSKNILLWQNSG